MERLIVHVVSRIATYLHALYSLLVYITYLRSEHVRKTYPKQLGRHYSYLTLGVSFLTIVHLNEVSSPCALPVIETP